MYGENCRFCDYALNNRDQKEINGTLHMICVYFHCKSTRLEMCPKDTDASTLSKMVR